MLIAINRFGVAKGCEAAIEHVWLLREGMRPDRLPRAGAPTFSLALMPVEWSYRRKLAVRRTKILSLLILCAETAAFAQRAPEPDVLSTEKEIKSFEK
jgi:hypothetical protein